MKLVSSWKTTGLSAVKLAVKVSFTIFSHRHLCETLFVNFFSAFFTTNFFIRLETYNWRVVRLTVPLFRKMDEPLVVFPLYHHVLLLGFLRYFFHFKFPFTGILYYFLGFNYYSYL